MTVETFFSNFGHLADAPNGVQKLRELILQLAVQGKLVPQDPNDEPASVLLERIEVEKRRLIKEGKIKKLTTAAPVKGEEHPFAAPQGWKWPRLDSICSYIQRGKGPQYVDRSDVPVVSQKCVQWAGFSLEPARFICPMSLDKYADERFLQTGDLLWNSTGTGTIGRINIYVHEENPYELVVADSHVTVVRPVFVNSRYVWIWLASPFIQTDLEGNASGSTNQVELSTSVVKAHVIPLPPLAEQKRIVAKVDELMTLCDELETRQQKQQQTRVRLNNAALDALLTDREPDEFAAHWQRIRTNFDLLYDHPETIGKLRAAILQLAVQGKLVPQDPNDEPASVLLERIRAERERLVRDGKIKKSKKQTEITKYFQFDIPEGWKNIRLSEIIELVSGQHLKPAEYNDQNKGIPYLTGPADFRSTHPVATRWTIVQRAVALRDDILITVKGSGVGKTNVLRYNEAAISRQLMAIRPILVDHRFLLNVLKTAYDQFQGMRTGIAIPGIGRDDVLNLILGLPPLEEQKRIVAKVDQLMALCDELETKLTQAQQHSEKLMNTTVQQLLVA